MVTSINHVLEHQAAADCTTFSNTGCEMFALSTGSFSFGCDLDTDGDGIPNHLDTDSDGDGCPDAVEGGGDYSQGYLNEKGGLNSAVDDNGVPELANGGQSVGASQDASDASACGRDTDCDGVNDDQDKDSDNDGICDEDEGLICEEEYPVDFTQGFPNISYTTELPLASSGNLVNVTGNLVSVSNRNEGTANGTLRLGAASPSDDFNNGDTYTLPFQNR